MRCQEENKGYLAGIEAVSRCLHLMLHCMHSVPTSAPHSSFLLMHMLKGRSDDSGGCVPDTHLEDLIEFMVSQLQHYCQPLGSEPVNGSFSISQMK